MGTDVRGARMEIALSGTASLVPESNPYISEESDAVFT